MIHSEHLLIFWASCFCFKMIYSEHLLASIFLRAAVSRWFTVKIYLSSIVLLFKDDLQRTFTYAPSCCYLKMTYGEHLLYPSSCCCLKMIYTEHFLKFLRSAVSRRFTMKIYLTFIVLLFQNNLYNREHLLILHRAAVWRRFTVNIYNSLRAAVSIWFAMNI
jgi:hypothetical protein